ncbi:MAG: HAD-IB family hydrolase [Actinomycetota bacterium]
MATAAAFFDLDRTLLQGASGPDISRVLRRRGVIPDRGQQVERALFGIFNTIGETLPSIFLSRQGARAAKGWSVAEVADAAEELGPILVDRVEPFATEAIEEHRRAGHKLVLATTTPRDLVEPFARLLGFDAVLATRYRSADGVYDGTIDGEFVWSRGKARSVGVWATANMIELADSYAYSDSIFDVPMLSMVGYPIAVNPDPRLWAYASLRGWETTWFSAPPGVPKPIGIEPQQILATAARPELLPFVDLQIEGLEHIPADGPVLLAANHRSYFDPAILGYLAAGVDRPVRFLTKKEVTDAAVLGALTRAIGAIRVDRGSGQDEPLLEAARILRCGEMVAMFPQGTIPRGHQFFEPILQGRHGAVRLAHLADTPITPVGIWGSERVWPRSSKLPYLMNLADPPTVTVRIGAPYQPDRAADSDTGTVELMARISDLLPLEAGQPYEPSEAELRLTYPPGHGGDEDDGSRRR